MRYKIKKYQLEYDFDLENKRFLAKEKIFVNLNKGLKNLILDSVDLLIKKVLVDRKETKFKTEKEKLIIFGDFKKENEIDIEFEGKLIEKLGGIYLSKYQEKGKEKYLITTQFEPVDARQAFPCFDNPNDKAIFELTLIIDKNLKAVSNTLPLKEEIVNNKKKIYFKPTPVMSTYLLYLGVGDFEFLEDKYKNILLRVVTTKGKSKGGKFALECAKKFLNYLEKYFNFPYVLEKLDLIAVPDFAAGAMENWGAITFRENILLFFDGITPESLKPYMSMVVAHELTHMWFGNLVTMKWWDDLWLNESFANYLGYKVVDHYFPQWEMLKDYVFKEGLSGMEMDKLNSTHPIKVEVKNPNEISEIFDEISYDKGGAILRMLDLYLGEENFKKGLQNYIKRFQYSNAQAKDLWLSLAKKSKAPVFRLMNDFINKSGFPIIYLKKEKDKYFLSQSKFNIWQDRKEKWLIPIIYEKDNKIYKFLMKKNKEELSFKNFNYLILNKDFSGFYLVDLSDDLIRKNIEKSNELDLLLVVYSYYQFVLRGEKKLENFYLILEEIINKKNFEEIKNLTLMILSILNKIDFYLNQNKAKEILLKIYQIILKKYSLKIKKDELPIDFNLKRAAILGLGYLFNNEKINKLSEKNFRKFMKNEKAIHPEYKLPFFVLAINQNKKYLEFLINYYRKTELIEEKRKCLMSLAYLRDKEELEKIFDFLLTKDVRFGNIIYFFGNLGRNSSAKNFVINWLEKNWLKLIEKGGGRGKSDFILIRILKQVIPVFGPFEKKEKLNKFFRKYKLDKDFKMTIDFVKELANVKRKFLNVYSKF